MIDRQRQRTTSFQTLLCCSVWVVLCMTFVGCYNQMHKLDVAKIRIGKPIDNGAAAQSTPTPNPTPFVVPTHIRNTYYAAGFVPLTYDDPMPAQDNYQGWLLSHTTPLVVLNDALHSTGIVGFHTVVEDAH